MRTYTVTVEANKEPDSFDPGKNLLIEPEDHDIYEGVQGVLAAKGFRVAGITVESQLRVINEQI